MKIWWCFISESYVVRICSIWGFIAWFKQKYISLCIFPCMWNPAYPHARDWYYSDPKRPPDGCSNVRSVYWKYSSIGSDNGLAPWQSSGWLPFLDYQWKWEVANMIVFNTLRRGQDDRHFPDDIFKCIFVNKNVWISPMISLKFIPKVRINNIPALVQIMAWRRPGDKPLSEPMLVSLLTHICVTRPQWVYTGYSIIRRILKLSTWQYFILTTLSLTKVLLKVFHAI